MPFTDEITPSEKQANWLLDEVIRPTVASIAGELGIPSSVSLQVHAQGKDTLRIGEADAFWLVRGIFRESVYPGELRIQLQGKIPRHSETGFCGFRVKGVFSVSAEPYTFRGKSEIREYNVDGFREWS